MSHRFHAKIYLFDTAALVGSSNLTDAGLQFNREAMILIDQSEDAEVLFELRAVFSELWDYASVLTDEALERFIGAHKRFRPADADELIGLAVGRAEPPNANVDSRRKTPERVFLEGLRRQLNEYRKSFNEVKRILDEKQLHRPELDGLNTAMQANRFLSWLRLTHAPGDTWETTPLRGEDERNAAILHLGREWSAPDKDSINPDYVFNVQRLGSTFGSAAAIDAASKEEVTKGLTSLHAFSEQWRFVKGGEANLPLAFWSENNNDVRKVKTTLKYLLHAGGDFVERLHDVLFSSRTKLRLFGMACALELCGTVKPGECPPLNGRILKGLRYLGFDVQRA